LHFTPFKLANFDLPRQSTEKAPEELICWLKEKQAEKESETEVVQQVDRWIRELVKGQCPKTASGASCAPSQRRLMTVCYCQAYKTVRSGCLPEAVVKESENQWQIHEL